MKGLLFKEPLFHNSVAGIKTITRRLFPEKYLHLNEKPDNYKFVGFDPDGNALFLDKTFEVNAISKATVRYKVGEVVFLKEPYHLVEDKSGEVEAVVYKFENPEFTTKWKNKMFMHEDHSRYKIEILGVSVERLHDITEESAIAEGIEPLLMSSMQLATMGQVYRNYQQQEKMFADGLKPIQSYKSLWDSINGKEMPWKKNPWVIVYKYKLI
jgi:hypothetical protein